MRARFLYGALPIVLACGGSPSDGPTSPGTQTSLTVQVSPQTVSIAELDSVKLSATAVDQIGKAVAATFSWSAQGAGVTVDQSGWVHGVSVGGPSSVTATVSGSNGLQSANAQVTVTLAPLASGTIYFGADAVAAFAGGPVSREIEAVNPNTKVVTDLTANPADDDFPVVSPDGQYLWFYTYRNVSRGEHVIMKKDGSGFTRLFTGCQVNNGVSATYCVTPDAWLLDSRLAYTIRDRASIGAMSTIQHLVLSPPTGAVQAFSAVGSSGSTTFSPSGTLGYSLQADGSVSFTRMSDGVFVTLAPACTFTSACTLAAWARDEKSIYLVREGSLYSFPIDGSPSKKLYTAAGTVTEMVPSPDGAQIALIENGSLKVFALSNSATKSFGSSTGQIAWSPDGKSVAYTTSASVFFDDGLPMQVWAINLNGSGKRKLSDGSYIRGISWGK